MKKAKETYRLSVLFMKISFKSWAPTYSCEGKIKTSSTFKCGSNVVYRIWKSSWKDAQTSWIHPSKFLRPWQRKICLLITIITAECRISSYTRDISNTTRLEVPKFSSSVIFPLNDYLLQPPFLHLKLKLIWTVQNEHVTQLLWIPLFLVCLC